MQRERSLTLQGALRILGRGESPVLDRLNLALGGVILASGAALAIGWTALAPAALLTAVWGMTEQKDTALELLRTTLDWVSDKHSDASGRERREVIAAAHTTIVAAAFFEVLEEHLGAELRRKLKITEAEKVVLLTGQLRTDGEKLLDLLYTAKIPAPSAAWGFEENIARVGRWMADFSQRLSGFLQGLAVTRDLTVDWAAITSLAVERYRSHFLELAAKTDEFAIWADLSEHAATRELVRQSNAELARELSLSRDALSQVFTLLSRVAGSGNGVTDLRAMMARINGEILTEQIVPVGDDSDRPGITLPVVGEIYINPRFRVALMDEQARPADMDWWQGKKLRDDFDSLLVAHVLSPDATRLPMLLLGDPGAGKSMLTKVFAARLPSAGFTVVRVPLRRVTASARITIQVQEALDEATGGRATWPQLSDQSAGTIPVILLDGLDELFQASPSDRSAYLHDVMEFQRTEAAVGRDVIVIVTSRLAVAERVGIPSGTTVVKLEAFTDEDITDWIARWNRVNSANAVPEGTFRALTPEAALRCPDLARQPLLLLMLALYTADSAVPALDAGLSTADLYRQLLCDFALREARKSLGRDARLDDVKEYARDHLDRLALAALAMFNRGRQDISEDEVGADLEAVDKDLMTRARKDEAGQRVLGEFFFVHAAEARLRESRPGEPASPVRRRYEFLHATFGEYLVAWYIVRELIDMAGGTLRGRRGLDPDDNLLFALLSHQPLAARRSILEFTRGICNALTKDDDVRRQVLDVLEVLVGAYRDRHGSNKYFGYRPTRPDMVRHLACYSANLVALRVALAPEGGSVPLTDLLRAPDNALAQWRSTVRLWQAGLDPDGLGAVLSFQELETAGVPRVRVQTPTMAVLSGDIARVSDIFLARLLGDQSLEQRIRYGAAIAENFHYREDLLRTEPSRWIHEFASMMIPVLAGLRPPYLAKSPAPGISDRDAQVAAGLILRYLDGSVGDPTLTAFLVHLLLFDLPQVFEIDRFAIARIVLRDPLLLESVPELKNPGSYGNAYPALRTLASDDLLRQMGGDVADSPQSTVAEARSDIFKLLLLASRETWQFEE